MQLHLHVADKGSTLHLFLFNPTHAVDGRVVYNFAVAADHCPKGSKADGRYTSVQVHQTFTKADTTGFSPLCHLKSHPYMLMLLT